MQITKLFALVVSLLLTAGCATGFDAATQQQQPTGNGRYIEVGELSVQNMTLVAGETNSALLLKIFNGSDQTDQLVQLSIGNRVVLADVEIPANGKLAYGNATNPAYVFDYKAEAGKYLPVRMQFEQAGIYETSVLVVAPLNQYEGLVN